MSQRLNFVPVWRQSSDLGVYPEGDTVTIPLHVEIAATVIANIGETSFDAGNQANNVDRVLVNNASLGFTISGSNIILTSPVAFVATVEVILSGTPSCSLLNGKLPLGLSLLSNGAITGTVSHTDDNQNRIYEFTARAKHSTVIRDRRFFIAISPASQVTVSWNLAAIPIAVSDENGIISSRIANLRLGGAFVFEPEIVGVGDAPAGYLIGEMEDIPDIDGVFNGILPLGLRLNSVDGLISGSISPDAAPGTYYFTMIMLGDGAPTPLALSIEVSPFLSETLDAPDLAVQWITPAGLLGGILEGEPSTFSILAKASTGGSISYSMLTGSSFPPGLVLDNSTGEIRGIAASIPIDTVYTFTIRATSGETFEDRLFQIAATNRYTSTVVLEFRFRLPYVAKAALWTQYASNSTLMQSLMRPNDDNFGLVRDPFIYVIGGIDGIDPDTGNPRVIGLDEYHKNVSLVLGRHKIAVSRKDKTGNVLYEVLYREIYDPLVRAGGFSRTTVDATEERVPYPQSRPGLEYVYPNSIRNLRHDIIDDFGFATDDETKKQRTGTTGIEGLPPWMASRQIANDPNSILGFVPSVTVAYLRPGTGAAVLAALSSSSVNWREGFVLEIDRYYVASVRIGQTTFDNMMTTFDSEETRFDTRATQQGKYYTLGD